MALRVLAALITVGAVAFFYLPGWILALRAKQKQSSSSIKKLLPWLQ